MIFINSFGWFVWQKNVSATILTEDSQSTRYIIVGWNNNKTLNMHQNNELACTSIIILFMILQQVVNALAYITLSGDVRDLSPPQSEIEHIARWLKYYYMRKVKYFSRTRFQMIWFFPQVVRHNWTILCGISLWATI